MKLQALTVSVNYADFLAHTLEANHHLFDKWVIVTDSKDLETQDLCGLYENVLLVVTDSFYDNGAKFNKYAGINQGLHFIDRNGWVLFLDGDIVLPNQTKRILSHIELDPQKIYGIDRVNCKGRDRWEEFKSVHGDLVIDNWLLAPDRTKFTQGSRLVHYFGYENGDGKFAGWNPIGFFQLVHGKNLIDYPQDSSGADHCDLMFARRYSRSNRILIPELIAVHLESDHMIKAANWYGRVSPKFISDSPITFSYLYRVIMVKIRLFIIRQCRRFNKHKIDCHEYRNC